MAKIRYLTAVLIFGTTGLILRWSILPSEIMVVLRGFLGAVFLLAFLRVTGRKPDRKAIHSNLFWLLFGGVSLGVNWVFLFAAYRVTSVALASLMNYTAPIIVIFLSPLLFGEKLTLKSILCIMACACGVLLVSGVRSTESDPVGVFLGFGAALGFVGIIIGNKRLKEISPYDRVIVQLLISAAVVTPYAIIRSRGTIISCDTLSVLLVFLLAAVYTGVAYSFYFGAMGVLPVRTIALLGYLEPVVSVICSAVILKEPLGLTGIIGAALVVGAAAVSEL